MKRRFILPLILFLIVLALNTWHLFFMEFKDDQLQAITLGNQTRQRHFLITHGIESGVRVNNPPLFLWLMGLITFFTNNPLQIAAVFMALNMLAFFLALSYFYSTLPESYAALSSLLLAFSGSFLIYADIIWAQCLLPCLMIVFQIYLYRLIIREDKATSFLILAVIVSLAAQLHMSGFFIFPALLIVAFCYRRQIRPRVFIAAGVLVTLLFLPYLWHIFAEGELSRLIQAVAIKNNIAWKIFRQHLRMSSFEFFRSYFRYDFNAVLGRLAGRLGFLLYLLSCILFALSALGLLSYLAMLARKRRFFNLVDRDFLLRFPLPFQIAGFLLVVLTAGFLVLRIPSPLHYLIVLFPAHSLLAGFAAFRLWQYRWLRPLILGSIFATAALVCGALLFLERSGGHYYEYGPSYAALSYLGKRAAQLAGPAGRPLLSVNCPGKGKCDKEAITWVVEGDQLRDSALTAVPLQLDIVWDDDLLSYLFLLSRSQ